MPTKIDTYLSIHARDQIQANIFRLPHIICYRNHYQGRMPKQPYFVFQPYVSSCMNPVSLAAIGVGAYFRAGKDMVAAFKKIWDWLSHLTDGDAVPPFSRYELLGNRALVKRLLVQQTLTTVISTFTNWLAALLCPFYITKMCIWMVTIFNRYYHVMQ